MRFGGSISDMRPLSIGLAAVLPMEKGVFFKMIFSGDISLMVRERGFEPLRPKTPEPKSGASANSATRARSSPNYHKFLWKMQAASSRSAHFSKGKSRFFFAELARKSPTVSLRCVYLCAG